MRFKSIKGKLLLAVSALVIGTGLFTSLLVSQRYSLSLFGAMRAEAENLAHAVALDAADKILINDMVALQKMLEHHLHMNSSISYLFIYRDDQILAHTFGKGVPADLVGVNIIPQGESIHFQRIVSTTGEHYLDVAWPIFEGKAGTLRFGFSETPCRRQMTRLWVQMGILTFGILSLALSGTLFFVKRITRPLSALAKATERIDGGEQNVRVQVEGEDEVATLGSSFNRMVGSMEDYTRKLEEQTTELERAHYQTRTSCGIVQEISSLRTLPEIGSVLVKKMQDIMKCGEMVLLIFNQNRDLLFVLSAGGTKTLKEPEWPQKAWIPLENIKKATFTEKGLLDPPFVPVNFQAAPRQAYVPIHHENQPFGVLVIACFGGCKCNVEEVDIVGMILAQAAGAIKRAVLQEEELHDLRTRIETTSEFCGIVGKDPKMQMIYKLIEDVAPTDAVVLIQGENGTGKELVARAVHQMSPRKEKPFIVINCSVYPATLLESELFGHEKGAFTGAIRQKSGRFEQAHGGTVFLDEIGEISSSAQLKLLRVLQTQKFERLGGEQTVAVDVRVLAATNKDLPDEVEKGRFREDLFYRLNVIPISLPAIRERRNDIPLLAHHFLGKSAVEQGKQIENISPEAMRVLLDYPWPGNVRELENSVEHATVLAKGHRIEASDLPAILHTHASNAMFTAKPGGLLQIMAEHEKGFLQQVLEECGWNKKMAARRLGISRNTLYEKLKKHQISSPTTH